MITVLLVQGGWVKCVEQYLVNVKNVDTGIEAVIVRGVKNEYILFTRRPSISGQTIV